MAIKQNFRNNSEILGAFEANMITRLYDTPEFVNPLGDSHPEQIKGSFETKARKKSNSL